MSGLKKYVWLSIGALILLFALTGCSINQQFVEAVDASWTVIGPEYLEYVQEDEDLDDQTKANRRRTATILTDTINEAKK